MTERRKSPRARCRLHCRIRRGRDRIRARVLDISEGGLCLLSPVELKKGQSLEIEIDVPGQGASNIHAEVWHVRRTKSRSTRRWTWSAGMILEKSDDTYPRLFAFAESDCPPGTPASATHRDPTEEAEELQVFRVRVQVQGEPRGRLLTLGATSEKEVRELAAAELDDSWVVTEVQARR